MEFKDSLIPKFHSVIVLCLLKLALSHRGSNPLSALTHIFENIYVKDPKRGKDISCFHSNPVFSICVTKTIQCPAKSGQKKLKTASAWEKDPICWPCTACTVSQMPELNDCTKLSVRGLWGHG